jgi:hypothetical protein
MRFQSRLGKLWQRLSAGVVQDVPPSLEECESCREADCTQERWESCPRRLAAEAAAMTANLAPSARTDEMPGPSAEGDTDCQPGRSDTPERSSRAKPASS